ncbi:MAG: Cof-type HAD-IIB family hydrolase [Eubacteriales bacterium]|nr:Cof-type HAD-IIB family hydrolase [Eubacteriales bacterium]
MIKLIALDMDGTLLDSRSQISQFNMDTIKKAQLKGLRVAICTGRFPENIKIMLDDIGLQCDIIALNGATVDTNGKRIHQAFLPIDIGKEVFEMLEKHDAKYVMFQDHRIITRKEDTIYHAEKLYGERLKAEYGVSFERGYEAAKKAVSGGVSKFFVFDSPENTAVLNEMYGYVKTVENVDVTRSGPHNFEVMPKNTGKGVGIQKLAEFYNIPMSETMAVGDHENDITMIRAAGLGVAMGNAIDLIKKEADVITDTNDQDGVAKAILHYAMGEEAL